VATFLGAARLVTDATSFGGLHTSADRRERWGDPVPPGLVRLSAGCEDTADLVADVRAALDAVAAAG
jgi:cystathionine gamma-lyase